MRRITGRVIGVLAMGAIFFGSSADGQARQSELAFSNGAITLQGTLTLPSGGGPWPAAIIIAGSGPTDRDGNTAMGKSGTYSMLASALAERGIASLRYDKRGLPSSKGSFDMAATTVQDFAADAAAAARVLEARGDIGPVVFVGHSEGGLLALLAAKDRAPVSGLVLVATAGRGATTILREQLSKQLPPPLLAQFDTAWAGYIKEGGEFTAPAGLEMLFVPANRRFMQSWQAADPVALLRGLSLPTLVVQGETDIQVTAVDAKALAGARSDVKLVMLPGVNHVLKEASGATAQAQMASYADPSLPLGPGVAKSIADWILTLRR